MDGLQDWATVFAPFELAASPRTAHPIDALPETPGPRHRDRGRHKASVAQSCKSSRREPFNVSLMFLFLRPRSFPASSV